MARRGGQRPWPGRRRRRGGLARPCGAGGSSTRGVRVDRASAACPPTPSEPHGDCRAAVASGARGQSGDRRARRGDAGDGGGGRRRHWPGDHVCRDQRGGRGHRPRERRAHGASGPAADGDLAQGHERRVDRPNGRLIVSSPRRTRERCVETPRGLDAHRHVSVASETGRAARRARPRRGVVAVGHRAGRPNAKRSPSMQRCAPTGAGRCRPSGRDSDGSTPRSTDRARSVAGRSRWARTRPGSS